MAWKLFGILWIYVLLQLKIVPAKSAQCSSDEKLHIPIGEHWGATVLEKGVRGIIFCCGHEPGMQWLDLSGKVVKGRGPGRRVHVEEDPERIFLVFDDPQLVDNGTWICKAGRMERSIQVIVVEVTQYESWKEYVTAEIGHDATLMCVTRGVPPPQLSWYRNNRTITERTSPAKYEVWKDKLVIHHVSIQDAGEYECRASQASVGWQNTVSAVARLLVLHGPIIEGDPVRNVLVLYDHIHVIRCSTTAFPKPLYRWSHITHKGERVIPDYGLDMFTARNGSYSELTVRVNGKDELGDYVCNVRNKHGQAKVMFQLRKGTKPEPPAEVVFKSATNESLLFDVKCSKCSESRNHTITPEDIIGYKFELMKQPLKGLYAVMEPVYWEEERSKVLTIDTTRTPAKLFAVKGLHPSTTYVARVASFNLAGPSDFIELDKQFTTTADAACDLPSYAVPITILVAFLLRFRRD